jgi:fucose permease
LTGLATATFLALGSLLVLFGANATEIISSLELDYADVGLLGSMLSLGLGLGIVIAGPIADRMARRPIYIASCAVVIASTMTLGPETTFAELMIRMIAIGFGAGFYETVLSVIIIEEFGDAARQRLLFIHAGAPLAACLVPLLMGLLRLNVDFEWYTTFRIVGLLHVPLIVAACFQSMKATPTLAAPVGAGAERNAPSPNRIALAGICLATFAYVGVESSITIFVADHTVTDLGLSAERAAWTISSFWGGLFVGRLASGFAPRSPGAGITAVFAFIGAGIILAFGLGWVGYPEISMATAGIVLGGVFPVMVGLAGQSLPASPATAVGLAGGLGSLGGFVIPWCTGELARSSGLPFAITTLSAWLLLLVAAALVARSRRPA